MPATTGNWSVTLTAQNRTGGDLHAINLQGGTAGWLSNASAATSPSAGTVSIKPPKNQGQTVTWSGFSLANGASASITVIVPRHGAQRRRVRVIAAH